MGFWHTGYMEFHESTGFGHWKPSPPEYVCADCGQVFGTSEAVGEHRFIAHPVKRPVLFIDGREATFAPIAVRRRLDTSEVLLRNCDVASIDGQSVPPGDVATRIASLNNRTVSLVLHGNGITSAFDVRIDIASEDDLAGVESEFERLVRSRSLTPRSVEAFIEHARHFPTALGYCDGICNYLYGVLARESIDGFSVPQAKYVEKFNAAIDGLRGIERALARTLTGLVQFHFNQFEDVRHAALPGTRLSTVASRYAAWLSSGHDSPLSAVGAYGVDSMVTDWRTEELLRFASSSLTSLGLRTEELEALMAKQISPYDEGKLTVLLAEVYLAIENRGRARKHVKAMRNVPGFEAWAAARIDESKET